MCFFNVFVTDLYLYFITARFFCLFLNPPCAAAFQVFVSYIYGELKIFIGTVVLGLEYFNLNSVQFRGLYPIRPL